MNYISTHQVAVSSAVYSTWGIGSPLQGKCTVTDSRRAQAKLLSLLRRKPFGEALYDGDQASSLK